MNRPQQLRSLKLAYMARRLSSADVFSIADLLEKQTCRLEALDLSGNYKAMTKGIGVILFALRDNACLARLVANDIILTADAVFQPL